MKKTIQTVMIIRYLQKGKSITPLEALKKFGCFSLAQRIYDLRNMGYIIYKKNISYNGKTFASYFLPQKANA